MTTVRGIGASIVGYPVLVFLSRLTATLKTRERRKMTFVTSILFVLIVGVAPAALPWEHEAAYTLTVTNSSSREIRRLHMAWSGTGRWGPDRLGRDTLRPNASIAVRDIPAGDYDILFVDASENQCVVRNLPIYNDTPFTLTDRNCQR